MLHFVRVCLIITCLMITCPKLARYNMPQWSSKVFQFQHCPEPSTAFDPCFWTHRHFALISKPQQAVRIIWRISTNQFPEFLQISTVYFYCYTYPPVTFSSWTFFALAHISRSLEWAPESRTSWRIWVTLPTLESGHVNFFIWVHATRGS